MTTTIAGTTATSNTTAGRPTSSEKPSTHPLTPVIGAEITGVRLPRSQNGVVAAIQAALLDHKVLFFRTKILPRPTRSPSPNVWEN